ncbi:uncharacterized protein LOC128901667 isoform X2 [Rissa tridactyla]|uniref:uncharacterized protein LOC128901667 isoform X2 n=1 Tax=Rissa tridactyla TaxID=75485 RepID=UPI0023BB0D84|nr:uncharacterized protein LOC128901667 isoform X2 [Rissa tridactyla]XP_054039767.1 uncharacterized protein LOC128901667 isoform X2 [Rissa tridactyla]
MLPERSRGAESPHLALLPALAGGFLGCQHTLSAPVELLTHQHPQVLLLRAALPSSLDLCLGWGLKDHRGSPPKDSYPRQRLAPSPRAAFAPGFHPAGSTLWSHHAAAGQTHPRFRWGLPHPAAGHGPVLLGNLPDRRQSTSRRPADQMLPRLLPLAASPAAVRARKPPPSRGGCFQPTFPKKCTWRGSNSRKRLQGQPGDEGPLALLLRCRPLAVLALSRRLAAIRSQVLLGFYEKRSLGDGGGGLCVLASTTGQTGEPGGEGLRWWVPRRRTLVGRFGGASCAPTSAAPPCTGFARKKPPRFKGGGNATRFQRDKLRRRDGKTQPRAAVQWVCAKVGAFSRAILCPFSTLRFSSSKSTKKTKAPKSAKSFPSLLNIPQVSLQLQKPERRRRSG